MDVTLHLVTRTLELSLEGEEQYLTEALMWPELATLGNRERRIQAGLGDLAEEVLRKGNLDELSRHVVQGEPEIVPLAFPLPREIRSEFSVMPEQLSLEVVIWQQGAHWVASLPALGIAVLAETRLRLDEIIPEHVEAALKRLGLHRSLLKLTQLERSQLKLHRMKWQPKLETAEERRKRTAREDEGKDPLDRLTSPMEGPFLARAFGLEEDLRQLARLLTLPGKPSVLLVGHGGVGKTALIQQMARQRGELGLGRIPFHRSSGARLVAGATGFGMWQQRCRELIDAVKRRPVVLFLGNLFELVNVGQSSAGSESIAGFLRPSIARGELQVILECTPDQLAVLEKDEARLVEAFRIMRLEEPLQPACEAILSAVAASVEMGRTRFSPEALRRTQLLHRRYMGTSALPGVAIRFMRRLKEATPDDTAIDEAKVYEAFSRETGMPLALLDPQLPLSLAETERWLAQRVQGQARAVDAVVAMIAQMKAGLSRPGRPLASLLFIGPTGTGKTEMAKALAEFLFQSPERMVRLDMSEYSQPWSAQRLVSGSHDGREGILTAAVREQPFCVLLLDEFEKANEAVFDLLLQVLGEARLTDGAGRTADFSNCVVIMTSNLGAAAFGKGQTGFRATTDEDADVVEHFQSAVQQALRPEMFNRIDRIVPYLPLTAEIVLDLTRREVIQAAQRAGLTAKGLRLEVSEALLRYLAAQGYDPRYGARPLKRRVNDLLLAPVSALLAEGVPAKSRIFADLDGLAKVQLQVTGPSSLAVDREAREMLRCQLETAGQLRQRYEILRRCTMVNGLTSRLRLAVRRKQLSRRKDPGSEARYDGDTAALKKCLDGLEQEAEHQMAYEESLMLALYQNKLVETSLRPVLTEEAWMERVLEALTLWQPPPTALTLFIQGLPGTQYLRFAAMYRDLADALGGKVEVGFFWKPTAKEPMIGDEFHARPEVPKGPTALANAWKVAPDKHNGVVLWITGARAITLLRHEGGMHRSKALPEDVDAKGNKRPTARRPAGFLWQCRVDVDYPEGRVKELEDFEVPHAALVGWPDLDSDVQRRLYDPVKMQVREGQENERSDGSFSLDFLKTRLLTNALKEALE